MKVAIAASCAMAVCVGLAVAAGAFIRGPYSAADEIVAAMRAPDHRRLTRLVDWSAMRSSIAAQIRQCGAAAPFPQTPGGAKARTFATSVAAAVSDVAAETLVTPANLALALRGAPLLKALASLQPPEQAIPMPTFVGHSVSWTSASAASADLMFATESQRRFKVRLELTRTGYSDWLLSGISLGCP